MAEAQKTTAPADAPKADATAATPKAVVETAKPKVDAPASTKAKFKVVSGKHLNDDGTYARQGDIVTLDIKVAAAFTNKFARVVVNAAPVDEEGSDE